MKQSWLLINFYLLWVTNAQVGPVTKFKSESDFPIMKLRIIFEQPKSNTEILQYKLKLEVLTEPGDCYFQYYIKCRDCSGSNIGSGKEQNPSVPDCKGNNISKEEFYFNKNDNEINLILNDGKILPNLKFKVYIYAGDSYGWGRESAGFTADILGYPPHCPNVTLECNKETIIVNVSKSPDYDGKAVSKYVTRFVKNDRCVYSISTSCGDCGTNNFGKYNEQPPCNDNTETTFSRHDQVMIHNVSSTRFNESKITVYSVNSERWSIGCISHECPSDTPIGPVTKFRSESDFPNMKLRIIFEQPISNSEIVQYKLKLNLPIAFDDSCYLQYILKCGDCSGSKIGSAKEKNPSVNCTSKNITKQNAFNKNDKEVNLILDDEELKPNLKFKVYIYAGNSYGWGSESRGFDADINGYPPYCPNVTLECNKETIKVTVFKAPNRNNDSVSKYVTRFVNNDTCEYSVSTLCRDCGTSIFGTLNEQIPCKNNTEITFSKDDQEMNYTVEFDKFKESKITVYSVNSEKWSINCKSYECPPDIQISPVTHFELKVKLSIIFEQPVSTSEIVQYKLILELLAESGNCYLQYYLKCHDCFRSNIGSGKEKQTIPDCTNNRTVTIQNAFNKNDKKINIEIDNPQLTANLLFKVYIYAGNSYGWGQESSPFIADILGLREKNRQRKI